MDKKETALAHSIPASIPKDQIPVLEIPVPSETDAVDWTWVVSDPENTTLRKTASEWLDVDELERLWTRFDQTGKQPLLRAQIIKHTQSGLGDLYQYIPCRIERDKNKKLTLRMAIPNLPEKTEILDIFVLQEPTGQLEQIKEQRPRPLFFQSVLNADRKILVLRTSESEDWNARIVSGSKVFPPVFETARRIQAKTFWKLKPGAEGLPTVSYGPVDYKSQADERVPVQEASQVPVLLYSDLIRIGNIFDDLRDARWWEYKDFQTGLPRLDVSSNEKIPVLQLAGPHDSPINNDVFGTDKTPLEEVELRILVAFYKAAFLAVRNGAQALNINMGSNALATQHLKVKQEGVAKATPLSGGSGLIDDTAFAARIVQIVREGAQAALESTGGSLPKDFQFPVSVKMRLAQDDNEKFSPEKTRKFLKAMQEAGASWIDVHTRTRKQGYTDDFLIKENRESLAKILSQLKKEGEIMPPIFVNGNVNNVEQVRAVRQLNSTESGPLVLGVMISRWLTSQLYHFALRDAAAVWAGQETTPATWRERFDAVRKLLESKQARWGDKFNWKDQILPRLRGLYKKMLLDIEAVGPGSELLKNPEVAGSLEAYKQQLDKATGYADATKVLDEVEKKLEAASTRSESRQDMGEWEQVVSAKMLPKGSRPFFEKEKELVVHSRPGIQAFLGTPEISPTNRFLVIENHSKELREGEVEVDLRSLPEIRNAYLKRNPHLASATIEDAFGDFWLWDPFAMPADSQADPSATASKGRGQGQDFNIGANVRVASVKENIVHIYFKLQPEQQHSWALRSAEVLDHFHAAWKIQDQKYDQRMDETLVMRPMTPHDSFENEVTFEIFEKISKSPYSPSQLYRATIQGDPSGRIYVIKRFSDEDKQEQEEDSINTLMTALGNQSQPRNLVNEILARHGVQARVYNPLLFKGVRAFKTSTGEEKPLWAYSESLAVVYPYVEGLDWGSHLKEIQSLSNNEYLLHVLNIMVRASKVAAVLESEGVPKWDIHFGNLVLMPNEDLAFIDYQKMELDVVKQLVGMFLEALKMKGIASKKDGAAPELHLKGMPFVNDLIRDILQANYLRSSDSVGDLVAKFSSAHHVLSQEMDRARNRSEIRDTGRAENRSDIIRGQHREAMEALLEQGKFDDAALELQNVKTLLDMTVIRPDFTEGDTRRKERIEAIRDGMVDAISDVEKGAAFRTSGALERMGLTRDTARSEMRMAQENLWVEKNTPRLAKQHLYSRQFEAGYPMHVLKKIEELFDAYRAGQISQTTLTGGLGALLPDLFEAWAAIGMNVTGIHPLWNFIKNKPMKGLDAQGQRILFSEIVKKAMELTPIEMKVQTVRHGIPTTVFFRVYKTYYETHRSPQYYLDGYTKTADGKEEPFFGEVYDDAGMREVHMAVFQEASERLIQILENNSDPDNAIILDHEVFVSLPQVFLKKAKRVTLNHTVFRPGLFEAWEGHYGLFKFPEWLRSVIVHDGKISIADFTAEIYDLISGVNLVEHLPALLKNIFRAAWHRVKGFYDQAKQIRSTNGIFLPRWQSPARRELIERYKRELGTSGPKFGLPAASNDREFFQALDQHPDLRERFKTQNEWAIAADAARLLIWLRENRGFKGSGDWLGNTFREYQKEQELDDAGLVDHLQKMRALFTKAVEENLPEDWTELESKFGQARDLILKDPIASNIRRQVPYKGPDKYEEILSEKILGQISVAATEAAQVAGISADRSGKFNRPFDSLFQFWKNYRMGSDQDHKRFLKEFEGVRTQLKDQPSVDEVRKSICRVLIGGRTFDEAEAHERFLYIRFLTELLGLEDRIATLEDYTYFEAQTIFSGVQAGVMLSDQDLEASATSMMKVMSNGGEVVGPFAGSNPEIWVIRDRKTGKSVEVLNEKGEPAYDYKTLRDRLHSGEWELLNGVFVDYDESEKSTQEGGGWRPSARSLLEALKTVKTLRQDPQMRRERMYQSVSHAWLVDMVVGQAMGHAFLLENMLKESEEREAMFSQLKFQASDYVVPVKAPDFEWQGISGRRKHSAPGMGLFGMFQSFRDLKTWQQATEKKQYGDPSTRGIEAQNSLRHHAYYGDIFKYLQENILKHLSPGMDPFKKTIEEMAAKAATADEKERIILNLQALDLTEALLVRMAGDWFERYMKAPTEEARLLTEQLTEGVKTNYQPWASYIARYLDHHSNARALGTRDHSILSFVFKNESGEAFLVNLSVSAPVKYEETKEFQGYKARTQVVIDPEAFSALVGGDVEAKEVRISEPKMGKVYKIHSKTELMSEIGIGIPMPLGIEVLKWTPVRLPEIVRVLGRINDRDMTAMASLKQLIRQAAADYQHTEGEVINNHFFEQLEDLTYYDQKTAAFLFKENLRPLLAIIGLFRPDLLKSAHIPSWWSPRFYEDLLKATEALKMMFGDEISDPKGHHYYVFDASHQGALILARKNSLTGDIFFASMILEADKNESGSDGKVAAKIQNGLERFIESGVRYQATNLVTGEDYGVRDDLLQGWTHRVRFSQNGPRVQFLLLKKQTATARSEVREGQGSKALYSLTIIDPRKHTEKGRPETWIRVIDQTGREGWYQSSALWVDSASRKGDMILNTVEIRKEHDGTPIFTVPKRAHRSEVRAGSHLTSKTFARELIRGLGKGVIDTKENDRLIQLAKTDKALTSFVIGEITHLRARTAPELLPAADQEALRISRAIRPVRQAPRSEVRSELAKKVADTLKNKIDDFRRRDLSSEKVWEEAVVFATVKFWEEQGLQNEAPAEAVRLYGRVYVVASREAGTGKRQALPVLDQILAYLNKTAKSHVEAQDYLPDVHTVKITSWDEFIRFAPVLFRRGLEKGPLGISWIEAIDFKNQIRGIGLTQNAEDFEKAVRKWVNGNPETRRTSFPLAVSFASYPHDPYITLLISREVPTDAFDAADLIKTFARSEVRFVEKVLPTIFDWQDRINQVLSEAFEEGRLPQRTFVQISAMQPQNPPDATNGSTEIVPLEGSTRFPRQGFVLVNSLTMNKSPKAVASLLGKIYTFADPQQQNSKVLEKLLAKASFRSEVRAIAKDQVQTIDPNKWFFVEDLERTLANLTQVVRQAESDRRQVRLIAVSSTPDQDELLSMLGFARLSPRQDQERTFLGTIAGRLAADRGFSFTRTGSNVTLSFSNGEQIALVLTNGKYSNMFENLLKNALQGTEKQRGIESFGTEIQKGGIRLKNPMNLEYALTDETVLAKELGLEPELVANALITQQDFAKLPQTQAVEKAPVTKSTEPSAQAKSLSKVMADIQEAWNERESHWAVQRVKNDEAALTAWDALFKGHNDMTKEALRASEEKGSIEAQMIYQAMYHKSVPAEEIQSAKEMVRKLFGNDFVDETPYEKILQGEAALQELIQSPVDQADADALENRIEKIFRELVRLQNLIRNRTLAFSKYPVREVHPEIQFFFIKDIVQLHFLQSVSSNILNGSDKELANFAVKMLRQQTKIRVVKKEGEGKTSSSDGVDHAAVLAALTDLEAFVKERKAFYDANHPSLAQTVGRIYGEVLEMNTKLPAIEAEKAFTLQLRQMLDLLVTVWSSDQTGLWSTGMSASFKMDEATKARFQKIMEQIMIPLFMDTPEEVRTYAFGEKLSVQPRSEIRTKELLEAPAPIVSYDDIIRENVRMGGGLMPGFRGVTEKLTDGIVSLVPYTLDATAVTIVMNALVPTAFAQEAFDVAAPATTQEQKRFVDAAKILLRDKTLKASDVLVLAPEFAIEHGAALVIRKILGDVPVAVLVRNNTDRVFLEEINTQLRLANRPLLLPAGNLDEARRLLGKEVQGRNLGSGALNIKAMVYFGEKSLQAAELLKTYGDAIVTPERFQRFLNVAGVSEIVTQMRDQYLATARSA